MRHGFVPSLLDVAYYALGYAIGSALFCGAYMWTYNGTIPGIFVALELPVALFYFRFAVVRSLAPIRSRWPRGVVCLWRRRRPISAAGSIPDIHVAPAVRAYALCDPHHHPDGDHLLGIFRNAQGESDACSLTSR
jgi:hypothetical protein